MARYADCFVIPLPKKNLAAYRRLSKTASRIWRDHGSIEYIECAGDDLGPGVGLPFPKLAKTRKGETVVFSWILYKSRKHRDQANAKIMKDPRMLKIMNAKSMPFDMKRMTMGGFEVIVDA
jgi:uncharacterized protein YbaA (DUF1428 family)